jgi:NAD(P)-dependent dehydrogenase (short-subunit alcohol dehydrogenase family)
MSTWRKSGNTAVVTGGASGLGLEAARRYLQAGMNVVIADRDEASLAKASDTLGDIASSDRLLAQKCDVSDLAQVEALREAATGRFGAVHCLMNNAGMLARAGAPWENLDELKTTLSTNLFGIAHGCHVFVPGMIEHGEPAVVINTGSKQGITRPPGNYAYNISKAGVLAYTESLAHAFRQIDGGKITAHLLIPGFVYTRMIERFIAEKPSSAWTAAQTVDFMLSSLDRGDFYILCPDNETPRDIDEKRIQWTVDDLIKNRPALSRWDPKYKDEFESFMQGPKSHK